MFWYFVGGAFIYWLMLIGLSAILGISAWTTLFILIVSGFLITLWREK